MKQLEKGLVYFFLFFACSYLMAAVKLSFGSWAAPKAGFLPVLASTAALIFILFILSQDLFHDKKDKTNSDDPPSVTNWPRFFFLLFGLFLYIVMINVTGYLFSTFMILIYLFKVSETNGWVMPCVTSAIMTFVSYIISVQVLGIRLP